jgi:hypothetical protein
VYAQRYKVAEPPLVSVLSDTPDPVTSGNSFTLSASGIVNASAASVQFYRESNGEAGLQVGAQGDTFVGNTTTSDSGFWSASIQTTGLAAGTYTYYAQATDRDGITGTPATTSNTLTPGINPPAVTAAAFIYETAPQRLTFTFNQDVQNSLSTASIQVQRLTPNPATITVSNPIWDGATNTATFNFTGILPDGDYRARLLASGVNNGVNTMAGDYLLNFFFLNGDLNHDRSVTISDFIDLAANFNTPVTLWSKGDLNYDGTVTISDFIDLSANFNKTLGTPLPALEPQAAASADQFQSSNPIELKSKHRKRVRPRSHHRGPKDFLARSRSC